MIQHRASVRWFLICFSLLALFVAGCHKKVAPPPPPPPPPPAPAAPTASLSADRTSINKGESAKLSWTTTNATNVSISPQVGAVTPQGSTSVSPADSTTYTLTASGDGGSASSTVQITVTVPPPPPPPPVHVPTFEELFDRDVHDAFFDLDKSDIRPDAQQALQQTATFLKAYPNGQVTIVGYCDERGSTEYNLALGQRRANAVKDYLVSLGVSAGNLSTTSVGKEKWFCQEHNESCWQLNRRGHFIPTK